MPVPEDQRAAHSARIQRYRKTEKGREVTRAIKQRMRDKLKAEMIEAYGGECACCGETEPVFLTLDHVNDDGGGRSRVNAETTRRRLRLAGWPKEGYRLLCFNCNTGRHINGGKCPHEEGK